MEKRVLVLNVIPGSADTTLRMDKLAREIKIKRREVACVFQLKPATKHLIGMITEAIPRMQIFGLFSPKKKNGTKFLLAEIESVLHATTPEREKETPLIIIFTDQKTFPAVMDFLFQKRNRKEKVDKKIWQRVASYPSLWSLSWSPKTKKIDTVSW